MRASEFPRNVPCEAGRGGPIGWPIRQICLSSGMVSETASTSISIYPLFCRFFIVPSFSASASTIRCMDLQRQGHGQILRQLGLPKKANHRRMVLDSPTDCTRSSRRFPRNCIDAEEAGHSLYRHEASFCGCDRTGHVPYAIASDPQPCLSILLVSMHLRSMEGRTWPSR